MCTKQEETWRCIIGRLVFIRFHFHWDIQPNQQKRRVHLLLSEWKMPTRCEICCEIMIAVLLPPVGVCFRHGCCSVRLFSLLWPFFSSLWICHCPLNWTHILTPLLLVLSICILKISFFVMGIQIKLVIGQKGMNWSIWNLWYCWNLLQFDCDRSECVIVICAGWIHHLLAPYYTRVYSWYNLCPLCHYLCWSWSVLWWV